MAISAALGRSFRASDLVSGSSLRDGCLSGLQYNIEDFNQSKRSYLFRVRFRIFSV